MKRALFTLLALLCFTACSEEPQPQPETEEPISEEDTLQPADDGQALNAMEGVWLFSQRDMLFAGGRFDGIRFDAVGRWQTLDVLENGSVKPSQNVVTGSTSITVNGTLVQTNLHLDTSGGIPLEVTLSTDGQRMSWSTNMQPWEYHLKRSSAAVSTPIPASPFAPRSRAELLAAIQGVWRFSQPDVTVAGAQCDGLRFDQGGRFEFLDVDGNGKLVPSKSARTGQVVFILSSNENATTVQMSLRFDFGSAFPVHSGWNSELTQMTWQLYLGPVVTLLRTDEAVDGAVPAPPYVPTTLAEGLAALQGVWLFSQRDTTLMGSVCDGVRFDEAGHWQTLNVLDDGRLVVAPGGLSGTTSFAFPGGGALTVQLILHPAPNSGYPVHTGWSPDRSRMSWLVYDGQHMLNRTQAEVSGP